MVGVHGLAAPGGEYTELERSPVSVFGSCGNVLFSVTAGGASLEGLERSSYFTEQLLRAYPDGVAKIMVALEGAPMPDPAVRKKIREVTERFQSQVLCSALVFEEGGAWATLMRMVANTMLVAIPSRSPRAMFGDVSAGAHWLHAQCGARAHFRPEVLANALRLARPAADVAS